MKATNTFLSSTWALAELVAYVHGGFFSRDPCPAACAGRPSEEWDTFSSMDKLGACEKPMHLDYHLSESLVARGNVKLTACTYERPSTRRALRGRGFLDGIFGDIFNKDPAQGGGSTTDDPFGFDLDTDDLLNGTLGSICKPHLNLTATNRDLPISAPSTQLQSQPGMAEALDSLREYFEEDKDSCSQSYHVRLHNLILTGSYFGSQVDPMTAGNTLKVLHTMVVNQDGSGPEKFITQNCQTTDGVQSTFGIVVDSTGSSDLYNQALEFWQKGECCDLLGSTSVCVAPGVEFVTFDDVPE